MNQKYVYQAFSYLLLFLLLTQIQCTFKLTKAVCRSCNKSIVVINHCRVRPIKRDISVFNMNVTLLQTADAVQIRLKLFKRENGYRPFLFTHSYDACAYMTRLNHPVVNMIYAFMKNVSNLNHSCPFTGDLIIKGLQLNVQGLRNLPLPNGDYFMSFTSVYNNFISMITDMYFELQL